MKKALDFLKKLKKNNSRDWFEAHRDAYAEAKAEMEIMVGEFIGSWSAHDPSVQTLTAKESLFRIFRDVRFSKDKLPYKTHFGAYISPGGKKSVLPGYYLHIEPGGNFLAGGLWMPDAEALRKVRQEIDYQGNELHQLLTEKKFKSVFGGLEKGHQLKTTPRLYDKSHPHIDYLRHTSFIASCVFSDETVCSRSFVKTLTSRASLVQPLVQFLKTALD